MYLDHLDLFVPMSTLSLNLVFPSVRGLFLRISMGFVFSGDILKPFSLVHLVTLFAASFNLVSGLIGALLLVTTTQPSAYPRIVHFYLIPLTISAIAIKNRLTLKTEPCTTPFLISFGF
jgi:hypothetical protein